MEWARSLYGNSSWDDNLDLFGLKIGGDIAGAFGMCAALMVSLPDFLNIGSDSNQDVRGSYDNFGYFLSLTALEIQFV